MTLQTQCQKHLKQLGIKDRQTLKTAIQKIFSKHDHQNNVMADLYRLVLPDWEQIEKIQGYPEAGRQLSVFISEQFMQFDRQHHPDCMPAGAWLNTGFSCNSNLDPWQISLKNCRITMK
jgi:hypothetical protein